MKPTSGKRSGSVKGRQNLTVLYDGWVLARAPGSPAALHLLEILSALPDGVDARIALPAEPAGLAVTNLFEDGRFQAVVEPVSGTTAGRLQWEQRILRRLAWTGRAALIHTTTVTPPMAAPCPVMVSPVEAENPQSGLAWRMRASFGKGGLSAALILWPDDVPAPPVPRESALRRVPAFVHEAFTAPQRQIEGVPENYVLVPGPVRETEMDFLAAAWSWAYSGLGEDWTLLVVGLDEASRNRLREYFRTSDLASSLAFISPKSLPEMAALYQNAGCVLLAGDDVPWGSAAMRALAAGCPLVAQERPLVDARVGPAGYLTPPGNARALGAAVLTTLVEESVGDALRENARRRASAWHAGNTDVFRAALAQIYAELARTRGG